MQTRLNGGFGPKYYWEGKSVGCSDHRKSVLLSAAQTSRTKNSELIQLIKHQLHEPLGPTLLVLQLLIREESLSPQGMDLIRMLQRSIKEEVRAIQELLTMIQSFVEQPPEGDTEEDGGPIGRIQTQSHLAASSSKIAQIPAL